MSLETLDDLSFESHGDPVAVLQTKHSVLSGSGLGDPSPDLWKTLRVWMTGRRSGEVPATASKFLISTATVSLGTACAALGPEGAGRDAVDGAQFADSGARGPSGGHGDVLGWPRQRGTAALRVAKQGLQGTRLDTGPKVRQYLQDLIWHRLDKIKPIVPTGLDIVVPDIGELVREVVIRHDIVHRAGPTRDGNVVSVSADDVRRVRDVVATFAQAIESELERRFPPDARKR